MANRRMILSGGPVCYDCDRFMRVLLLPPPLVQLNTPYPATPYLAGFLRLHAARLGLTATPSRDPETTYLASGDAASAATMS